MKALLVFFAALVIAPFASANVIICMKSMPQWLPASGNQMQASVTGPVGIIDFGTKRVTWVNSNGDVRLTGERQSSGLVTLTGAEGETVQNTIVRTTGSECEFKLQLRDGSKNAGSLTIFWEGYVGRAYRQHPKEWMSGDYHYCTEDVRF